MTIDNLYIPDLSPEMRAIIQEKIESEKAAEMLKLFQPIPPFPEKEMTDKAKEERLKNSLSDFWFFDKTYFPPEVYSNFYKPGWFHKEIVPFTDLHDKALHLILAGRNVAKTMTLKKKMWYDLLTGKRKLMGFGSEIMPTAERFLSDTKYLLLNNARIMNDFEVELLEASSQSVFCRTIKNPKGSFLIPFSYERSTKGTQRLFDRLDYFYVTDYENETSSLTKDAAEKKIAILNEARTSLSDDGVGIVDGNNFDVRTMMNMLCDEQEKGILSEHIKIHKYKSWDDTRRGFAKSIWYNKWPAKDEKTFWAMVKPKDEYDKCGSYQQEPREKSGDVFPDTNYHEWDSLPDDLKAVTYADLNCSLKGKGDTTAMVCFGFSVSMQKFFITNSKCKSYSDSSKLLSDYLQLWFEERQKAIRVISMEMDGNVTQESTWTNNILQYTRINGMPFPHVQFKRYKADDIVSAVEGIYKQDKMFFPPGFAQTDEGKAALKQFFGFRTKKEKKKDDFPDAVICAYQALIDQGIRFAPRKPLEVLSASNRTIRKL